MDSYQSLATESFSYSWLSDSNVLQETLRESIFNSYEGTSEEFGLTNSDIFWRENFDFDTSFPKSPNVLAHADELFSDGLIRPVFLDPSKKESSNAPDSIQSMSSSSFSSRNVAPTAGIPRGLLMKWRQSTWRTLRVLLRHVNEFRRLKVGCSRKKVRIDDLDETEWQVRSMRSSPREFPKPVTSQSMGDWCDHENSIYEAVLHCKRSIGK